MIIDNSYFKGNLRIPNVQTDLAPLGDRMGNQVDLNEYILLYEKEVMIYALGYAAYKSFIASFDGTGGLLPGAEQRWKDLVDGKEYTNARGDLVKWDGLRYTLGTFKYSLIADYVFCKFLNDHSRTFSGTGMVKEGAAGATVESSIPRVAESWDTFIDKYQGSSSDSDQPRLVQKAGLIGIDWSNNYDEKEISLHRFLSDNEADYSDVKFSYFGRINSFGI